MANRRAEIKPLSLIAVVFILQGCAAAPGLRMDAAPASDLPPGEPGSADTRVVEVEPITTDLLNQMEEERGARARQIVNEFFEERDEYRIGPSDVLQVTVWDHPELTIPAGEFRDPASSGQQVSEDGSLYYPYVGVMQVAGMTVGELRVQLTEQLSTYIENPQLDVRVVAFRSQRVYVVGEVNQPSVLPLEDIPMMITDAINLSGGLTEAAFKSGVNVSRGGQVHEIDLRALYDYADASQNLTLMHGDIVNVLDRSQQRVYVLGEVIRPGSVEIINGRLSLAAALGEVGGVDQRTAEPSRIYVIRGSDGDNPQLFHLNAALAYGLLLAERFELRAQDVIYVDTAGISRWNRVITQLLPSISVIGIVDNLGQ